MDVFAKMNVGSKQEQDYCPCSKIKGSYLRGHVEVTVQNTKM